MTSSRFAILGLAFVLFSLGEPLVKAVHAAEPDAQGVKFFETKIRPVLLESCNGCHSQQAKDKGKLKGGLLLDSREGILAGGDSGPAIVPGSPNDSLLLSALQHKDLKMPPKGKLSDEVVKNFETWIKLGAPDPRTSATASLIKSKIDLESGRKYWAFQPPQKSASPKIKNQNWATAEIDRFVMAELEAKKLVPVKDADGRVLVRRIYFDLVGLPPTSAEVDDFVKTYAAARGKADGERKLIEKLVDQLLQSPQFGERWGRHWLDVARFAESNGNVDNNIFPYAWRYRDWVIAALNADKPYDRFLVEQLAGDLLPADSPQQRNDLLVATGFLALTSKPRNQNNPDFGMDLVADQIEVTTTGILGLTVACARCHDHKFDPIPQTDYYALAGFFTSSDMLYGVMTRNNKQPDGKPKVHTLASALDAPQGSAVSPEKLEAAKKRKQEIESELSTINDLRKNKAENKNKSEKRLAKLKTLGLLDDPSPNRQKLVDELKEMEAVIAAAKPADSGQFAMGVRDLSRASDCLLCIRGESAKRGDAVPRGFVTVMQRDEQPTFTSAASGRRELAEWIASPQNPLTARVMVNRIWQHLFGAGLVRTPDNFGASGEPPTHPALLDHLAVRFVENGWSVKKLIREIMVARVYRLSSDHDPDGFSADPDNRWLWRHSPRRLEAEAIRDAMLAVTGELDLTPLKGTLIQKYESAEVRNDMGATITRMETKHRSVYLPVVRNNTPESLEPFDMADSSLIVGARDVTTVPAQSLFLMNSPFIRERSQTLAALLMDSDLKNDDQRVTRLFQLAFARSPSSDEISRARLYLDETAAKLAEASTTKTKTWATFCQAILSSAEFRYIE